MKTMYAIFINVKNNNFLHVIKIISAQVYIKAEILTKFKMF
jgi:hypothetical protein